MVAERSRRSARVAPHAIEQREQSRPGCVAREGIGLPCPARDEREAFDVASVGNGRFGTATVSVPSVREHEALGVRPTVLAPSRANRVVTVRRVPHLILTGADEQDGAADALDRDPRVRVSPDGMGSPPRVHEPGTTA